MTSEITEHSKIHFKVTIRFRIIIFRSVARTICTPQSRLDDTSFIIRWYGMVWYCSRSSHKTNAHPSMLSVLVLLLLLFVE